jgi:hypothetical protein
VGVVPSFRLVLDVARDDRDGLGLVTHRAALGDVPITFELGKTFGGLHGEDGGGERCFAVVDVADGADVDVNLLHDAATNGVGGSFAQSLFCDLFSTTSETRASDATNCRKAGIRHGRSQTGSDQANLFVRKFVTIENGELAMNNSIFVIKPYKWEGLWVFDDANVGLVKEPFVGGADTMIDVVTANLPNADKGFLAIFSANYFPDAQVVLDWVRADGGGNVYRWKEKDMEGWLCPALLRYFTGSTA